MLIPGLILLVVLMLAVLWLIGEAIDNLYLRRVAGPLFTVAVGILAYGAVALSTSFSDSIRYSGATKQFVSSLVSAIERGDADEAHAELRRFDKISYDTYEGGAFLEWLSDPVARLAADGSSDDGTPNSSDTTTLQDGG